MKKENLGIKIVSKETAFWDKVVQNLKTEIENHENALKYTKICLKAALEEQEKSKNA